MDFDSGFAAARFEGLGPRERNEIERHIPAGARRVCDVGRGCRDAAAVKSRLALPATEGESFDAFVFADVLECMEDPLAALEAARALAAPAATLVASVRNAGHLSLVRDLLLGRFDPVAAGLADAASLRWFTRDSLAETLERAGWAVELIEAVPREAAPEEEAFLTWACLGLRVERQRLRTYRWIAVATAGA